MKKIMLACLTIFSLLMLAACSKTENKPEAAVVRNPSPSAPVMPQQAPRAVADMSMAKGMASLSAGRGGLGGGGGAYGVNQGIALASAAYAPDYNSLKDEDYTKRDENKFKSTAVDPLSTFSADVDTASYTIIKRSVENAQKPNPDSVRIEEIVNYFDYDYAAPPKNSKDPVNIITEYTDCPWNAKHKLLKIALKAKDIDKKDLPSNNLVFLIDVSGSMYQENRLPLIKKAFRLLVDQLRPQDTVSIVTYASGVSAPLEGATGNQKEKIMQIIDGLEAGGSTSGSSGLELAYKTAQKYFIKKGNNRVILATDGDFNVGPSSNADLENQITKARDTGVFLSVLGFGMGNYKDSKVQTLANKGNGNYAYINDLYEAKKVLVQEFGATLFTVAKDVKLQVEFNPAKIAAYRLVGYEKRLLNNEDFNDDKKDAGEMGAGHTVTVFYEVIPVGVNSPDLPKIDDLKYTAKNAKDSPELLTVKMRYKDPGSDTSKLLEKPVDLTAFVPFDKASAETRFAAAAAQFGQILKDSKFKGTMTMDDVIKTARAAKGEDAQSYRADFIKMAELYKAIK